ncbi:MAG: VOC family protein [Defluviitaleaceae bacterium]|nr:VOC family protein [Defluviitaleaceae bacterium]MCL2238879.1 VOC family protein [Defluviitaleaceae bacterium]
MVMPYLHFNGNCEEAFRFYADCFGGKVTFLSRLNNEPRNPVMHATVMLTEHGGLTGSDSDPPEPLPEKYEILVLFKTREEVESVFSKLSEGATDITPFAPHPPPDDAGGGAYLIDKYGYHWMLCV